MPGWRRPWETRDKHNLAARAQGGGGYGRRCNARVTRPDKNHHGQNCTRKRWRWKCQNGDISDGKKDGCAKLGHVRMGPMTELPDPPCSSTVRMGQVLVKVEFSVQEAKLYGACNKPVAWRREHGTLGRYVRQAPARFRGGLGSEEKWSSPRRWRIPSPMVGPKITHWSRMTR